MAVSTIKTVTVNEDWEEVPITRTINTGATGNLKCWRKGKEYRIKATDVQRGATTSAGSDVFNCNISGISGSVDGVFNAPSNYSSNLMNWSIYQGGTNIVLNVRVLVGSLPNVAIQNNITFFVE